MSDSMLITGLEIISLDPDVGDLERGALLITDGRIAAVGVEGAVSAPEGAEAFDGNGLLAMPGFVDTHRHTWQSAMKHSYAELDPMVYFAEVLTRIGAAYQPEDVYIGNLLGSLASLSAGTTTLFDWSHVQNSPEHSDAAIRGLRESGVRAVFGHGWPTSADPRWIAESPLPHPADIRRLHNDYFAGGPLEGRISLAVAARGPEQASELVWREELEIARDLGVRLSVHVSAYERNRNSAAVSKYATSGVLGPDMIFVHCNYVSDWEFEQIAKTGGSISFGPHCEMNSQGIGEIPLLKALSAGLKPTLSGDTETKCAGDMFTQMKMIWAHYRATLTRLGPLAAATAPKLTLRNILEGATLGGAKALGLAGVIGTLSPGKRADVIFVSTAALNLAPMQDRIASVVLAAHEGNVRHVMVGGMFIKRDGILIETDTDDVVARARESQRAILGRAAS